MTRMETKMNNQRPDESKRIAPSSLLKTSCDLEYLLVGDLRFLLNAKVGSHTRPSLLVLLNRLILNLPDVLKLSSIDGYMETVLARRPNWSRQVDKLHQANLNCVATLILIRDCLESDQGFNAISKKLKVRLQKWIEAYSAIRCLESTMLQEAFTVEIGGEA